MFRILVHINANTILFDFIDMAFFFISSYIVTVPLDSGDIIGIVYVWIGNSVHPDDALLAQEIANEMYNVNQNKCYCFICNDIFFFIFVLSKDSYTIQVVNEGNEPENFFWVGLGDRLPYDLVC